MITLIHKQIIVVVGYSACGAFIYKGDDFRELPFAFLSEKVYCKRKEFTPTGSKFFPFTVGPILKGRPSNLDGVVSMYPFLKKYCVLIFQFGMLYQRSC